LSSKSLSPKSLLTRYRALLVLICVSAPSFMLQLDANIVAVSLPSISASLKANFAGLHAGLCLAAAAGRRAGRPVRS
jgi:hypothetical protein